MKSLCILAALALGLGVDAFLVPMPGQLEPRQRQGGGAVSMCTWTGHCIGDRCSSDNDCDLDYTCRSQKCADPNNAQPAPTTARPGQGGGRTTTIFVTTARPTTTRPGQGGGNQQPACEWEGHCLGATCKTENDCDGQLICRSGKCANPGTTVVTQTRPGNTQAPVRTTVRTTVVVPRPTQQPSRGGGQTPTCGDNPMACIGASCRQDYDCGFELIICKGGVCSL